jgi:hypothetical protein
MQAVGIHDHPVMKLGLKPSDPTIPCLKLADYLTGALPTVPASSDYLKGITFGLYENDKFGVCGPTSVANSRREITAKLKGSMQAPSQDDVFDLYRRSGNPHFDPNTGADDNGVAMDKMLAAVASGGIGGVKCLGYAKVDVSNIQELKTAVAVGGMLLCAVTLQTSQQSQTNSGVWDYKPSGQWGGHAILSGAYEANPEGVDVITWATRVRMTDVFMHNQLDEAWMIIWPEHLTNNGFLAGVNLAAFASDWEALTGQKFPATIPPTPTPASAGKIIIDPSAKTIVYPAGWKVSQSTSDPSRSDFF